MKSQDGLTQSSWWAGVDVPKFSKLTVDTRCEVCVVGAGIAGLSVAYHLARAGRKVIVIDDSQIGDGQSGRTSGHLSSEWDDRYYDLEKTLGEEAAKVIYESHAAAIDSIEAIAKREDIECDFQRVDGWLFLDETSKEKELDDELEAAHRAGFGGVEKQSRLPLSNYESGPCLRFPDQAIFHVLKYLAGLARAITKAGGEIYCGNRVIDVQGSDEKKHEPARVTTLDERTVACDAIVVCTNTPAPINDWMGIYTKQASYRTYVIGAEIAKSSVPNALYWDTHDPYRYVRIQPREDEATDLLLIGGEDHKTGQPGRLDAPFLALEQWARPKFPTMGKIAYRWSGQVQEPADGVAYIGLSPHAKPNVYVSTGDSGMGLTHSAIAGMLISDLILGKESPWAKVYDPSRKPTGSVGEYIKENINAAEQFTKYVTAGEVSDVEEIRPGMGAIMRDGMTKLAVYRDDSGTVHKCSAICTHLACIVSWNALENTWDCPCHGARYDPLGKVIMGPAVDDLAPVSE